MHVVMHVRQRQNVVMQVALEGLLLSEQHWDRCVTLQAGQVHAARLHPMDIDIDLLYSMC